MIRIGAVARSDGADRVASRLSTFPRFTIDGDFTTYYKATMLENEVKRFLNFWNEMARFGKEISKKNFVV